MEIANILTVAPHYWQLSSIRFAFARRRCVGRSSLPDVVERSRREILKLIKILSNVL